MAGERSYFLLLHGLSYVGIAVFLFIHMDNSHDCWDMAGRRYYCVFVHVVQQKEGSESHTP